ncbi:PfkB family carbohydrate kinase [Aquimarina celericrescens]|uniref:PfkB family carbohydrate kinase n=1 Tax=Aquimarina celericrescens TaxID=1964542 RepID=A0ABW5AX43_9FLAO|nr:sugar kinase [Aquimarina celericrescens]
MKKRIITIGEVMMRLVTNDHQRFLQANHYNVYFGGAEANVAISLSHFGQETVHITAYPDNDLGRAAYNYLKKNGVDTSYISFLEKGRMGVYFHEKGSMQRSSRIIYDRFGSSFSLLKDSDFDWDAIFEDASWLHWTGITPAISESASSLCKTAIQKAREKGITVSGDINYRRNLWQYGKRPLDIMPELIANTDVIIAGLSDFENCIGIKKDSFEEACNETHKRFPEIKTIAVTRRISISASENKLSALLYDKGQLYISKEYEMSNMVDRIGGGDAFMAGLIYGLLFKNKQEALEFALAASVLKHSIPGDANLVTVDEVNQLVKEENLGRLLR